MLRTPAQHGTWWKLFRMEKKWRQLVVDEVAKREAPPNLNVKKIKSTVIKGVIATFFPSRWKKGAACYVFVAFGENVIVRETGTHTPVPLVCPSGKARNIFRGDSLCELDAIYHLIHIKDLYPKFWRKLFLSLLLAWLSKNISYFKRHAFITNHDYYDKNSILVTVSWLEELNVLGLQHGLLRHAYLSSSIYPGYRNRIEAVYNPAYRDAIAAVKPPEARLPVLGAPFDVGNALDMLPRSGQRALYFVSSEDLGIPVKRLAIHEIFESCQTAGVDFFVRPHPRELSLIDDLPFPFAMGPKDELFRLDSRETVFVGYYSTFLYEAALRGYRTVWISYSASPGGVDDLFPEIKGMPNTSTHSSVIFNTAWIEGLFATEPVVISNDPVGLRMARLLKQLFPEVGSV